VVRLRNDDTRSLPAGVLTLYDQDGGTSFAGDARLGGLPAGETRLLSFSEDLRTAVETTDSGASNLLLGFSIAHGVLTCTQRTRQVIKFTITAPAKESRDLLLEFPRSGQDQTLSVDDGKTRVTEQTATAFRVPISLAAGEARTVTGTLDQPFLQAVSLLVDGNDTFLQMVISEDKQNAAGRAALAHILDLRRGEASKQDNVTQLRKSLEDVEQNEDRIRKNLAAVTAADPLRARLTKALDADETRIDQLRTAIDQAQTEADKSHRTLTDAVATLHI
jgi:hypothetical protein